MSKKLEKRLASFTKWEDVRDEWMKDPEFVKEYHKLDEEFELLEMMLTARHEAKLTQAQLAEKAGMKQEAIARIEGGGNPSYKTLRKIAKALDKKIALI